MTNGYGQHNSAEIADETQEIQEKSSVASDDHHPTVNEKPSERTEIEDALEELRD